MRVGPSDCRPRVLATDSTLLPCAAYGASSAEGGARCGIGLWCGSPDSQAKLMQVVGWATPRAGSR